MEDMRPEDVRSESPMAPPAPNRRRTGLWLGGGLALIALVGVAAFVGGRLLVVQAPEVPLAPPGGGSAGEGPVSFRLEMQSAEGLPDTPPDAAGLFDHRNDNSLFICSMAGGALAAEGGDVVQESTGEDEGQSVQTTGGGDCDILVEVVITGETIVYEDVTSLEPDGSGSVQQEVAPGSIDEIDGDISIQAWGQRTGDRLVARVLVYSAPRYFSFP